MKRSPSYVHRTPSGQFYFRIAVPKALRPYFGKREIKKALSASRATEAFGQAQPLAALVQKSFDECRVMAKKNSPPKISNIMVKLLDGTEFHIDQENAEEERKTAKAFLDRVSAGSKTHEKVVEDESIPLSKIIEEYCEEKRAGGSWKRKTDKENSAIYRLLVSMVGDIPIRTLDKSVAREVKKMLQALPPNMNKVAMYRNKTVQDIVSMEPKKKLSVTSVNKHLTRYASICSWAENQGYLDRNPFEGLQMSRSKSARDERKPFNKEDLRKLFSSEIYTARKYKHPYYFWLPLLGLFTGARQNELCQLLIDDIREENGIWFLDINERDEKSLKTPESARFIPLHSKLIALGFLDYVNRESVSSECRLFPELKKYQDTYSKAALKWFARYRKRCGVEDEDKAFHSFRHTFAGHLKESGVEPLKIAALMGHKDTSVTTGRYAEPYSVSTLIDAIEQLDFDLAIS